jgi:hypothetical protein
VVLNGDDLKVSLLLSCLNTSMHAYTLKLELRSAGARLLHGPPQAAHRKHRVTQGRRLRRCSSAFCRPRSSRYLEPCVRSKI